MRKKCWKIWRICWWKRPIFAIDSFTKLFHHVFVIVSLTARFQTESLSWSRRLNPNNPTRSPIFDSSYTLVYINILSCTVNGEAVTRRLGYPLFTLYWCPTFPTVGNPLLNHSVKSHSWWLGLRGSLSRMFFLTCSLTVVCPWTPLSAIYNETCKNGVDRG